MSKILFASDIHGRKSRAARLAEIVAEEKPDRVYLLGDFLYNGPRNGVPEDYDPMAVIESLSSFADIAFGVRGNCDSAIDLDLLPFSVEETRFVEENGKRIHLQHGDHLELLSDIQKGDIVVFGHTHRPLLEERKGVLVLNPGSISFPKGNLPASYLIFDNDTITLYAIEDGEPLCQIRLGE